MRGGGTGRRRAFGRHPIRAAVGLLMVIVLAAACRAAPGDFTGDRHADQVYVAWADAGTPGEYFQFFQVGEATPLYTGQPGDVPVAGDYDGDLKWEPAFLHDRTWTSAALADPIVFDPAGMPPGPAATPAGWYAPLAILPVPGDYDGTGKTVPAYYDQVDASWWVMGRSSPTQFGIAPVAGGNSGYDVPVPQDYDGDRKTDIAVYRPTDATFHYLSSKSGQEVVVTLTVPAGDPADLPVPATYDGLGRAQAAVTDLSGANWYVEGHDGTYATFPGALGAEGTYLPAPAAYDGNGKAEPALFDGYTNTFWIDGQAQPGTGSTVGPPDHAAVTPYALIVNIVRLGFYAHCRLFPAADGCAGVT